MNDHTQPSTVRGLHPATRHRVDQLAALLGCTDVEVIARAVTLFAPPVETRARAVPGDANKVIARAVTLFAPPVETRARAVPGDGREGSGDPSSLLPSVLPHVHLGGPCVFGDRCGQ